MFNWRCIKALKEVCNRSSNTTVPPASYCSSSIFIRLLCSSSSLSCLIGKGAGQALAFGRDSVPGRTFCASAANLYCGGPALRPEGLARAGSSPQCTPHGHGYLLNVRPSGMVADWLSDRVKRCENQLAPDSDAVGGVPGL